MVNFIYRPIKINNHPRLVENDSHAIRLLNAWRVIFPDSVDSELVDFEDWVENVVKFESALRQYPDANFFIIVNQDVFDLNGNPTEIPYDGLFLGIHLENETKCWGYIDTDLSDLINNYALTDTFKKHAGRKITLAGVGGPSSPDLLETIKQFVETGIHDLHVKVNLPKYQIERLSFNPNQDIDDIFYKSDTALAALHLESLDNSFIVQESVVMRYEYRMIIVNHHVTSGAGCIEEFTPLNNQALFDYQIRENRILKSDIIEDESIINRYLDFANRYALEMKLENARFSDYTLDLAIDGHGEVIVIECNPLDNFGLYAMNYDAILRSLVTNRKNHEDCIDIELSFL